MRSYMRDISMGRDADPSIPAAVGMTDQDMLDMYRLLAIAKYDERYVIPPAHAEAGARPGGARHRVQPRLRGRARAWAARGRSARGRAPNTPLAVENFRALKDRQTADEVDQPPAGRAAASTC